MSLAGKVLLGISLVALVAVAIVIFAPDEYRYSDQRFVVSDIVGNPYKYKGQSGVLDARALSFQHMAGDNVAIYSLPAFLLAPDDQIAVQLTDNEPPRSGFWRVYVEGTDEFTNALGAKLNISEVKYEGSYTPPPIAALPQTSQPLPAPTEVAHNSVEDAPKLMSVPEANSGTSEDASQPAAPIERITTHAQAGRTLSDKILYSCETNTHRIAISNAQEGTLRYRAWNKPKLFSDTPDIDLSSGKESSQGTGVCSYPLYTFSNGKVIYEIQGALGCSDGSEPQNATGHLSVTASGKQITDAWCY